MYGEFGQPEVTQGTMGNPTPQDNLGARAPYPPRELREMGYPTKKRSSP